MADTVIDRLGRPLHDLRVSVTDRCNFRCVYCMPKEVFGRVTRSCPGPRSSPSRRLRGSRRSSSSSVSARCGSRAGSRSSAPQPRGGGRRAGADPRGRGPRPHDEGSASPRRRARWPGRACGGSPSASTPWRMRPSMAMNDVGFASGAVLEGIDAARAAGLGPVKMNMVVRRGGERARRADLARCFRGRGDTLRFIEYMDVGTRTDGVWTTWSLGRGGRRGSTRAGRSSPWSPRTGRGGPALALSRRLRRDRGHQSA